MGGLRSFVCNPAGVVRGRRDSSTDESPRETELKAPHTHPHGPAAKPPPVPRLDFPKQSNVFSTSKHRRGSAVQFGQEKNLVRSSGERRSQNRGSLAASQEHLLHHNSNVNTEGSTSFLQGEHFDELREVIYSEVATLISQNEQRPEFLLELFRELQMVRSDSMKARAVQSIRDLLSPYPTETEMEDFPGRTVQNYSEDGHKKMPVPQLYYSTTTVDATPSETEEEGPHLQEREEGRAYAEPLQSTSSLSTPEKSSLSSDQMKKTAILRDAKMNMWKRFEHLEDIKNVKHGENHNPRLNNSPGTGQRELPASARPHTIPRIHNGALPPRHMESASAPCSSRVDMGGLEREVERVVDEVIPFLKDNAPSPATPQLLHYLRKLVLTLTVTKCVPDESMATFFHRQLSTILQDTLAKYTGQKLESCGEELLTDISEVVFNELAFFRLMQNIDTLGNAAEEENRARRKSIPSPRDAQVAGSDGRRGLEAPPIAQTADVVVERKEDASADSGLRFSMSEVKGGDSSEAEGEPEEGRVLSASLREFKANTPRLPPLPHSARDPETTTAVAKELMRDVESVLKPGTDTDEDSQSMHTPPQDGESGGREVSPPDDSLQELEEIPELLEDQESSQTPSYPMAFVLPAKAKGGGMPRVNSNPAHIDLNVEPHPSDHLSSPTEVGMNGEVGEKP